MTTKTFMKMPMIGYIFFLFFLAACSANSEASGTTTGLPMAPVVTLTARSTVSQTDFAATVGHSGYPVNRDAQDAQDGNLTTIHSAVDRPVAKFTQTVLNVPLKAKGVVYIQNDSANALTLVSDTAGGFAPFTIAHDTATSLIFHKIGTFKAHLKDFPISTDTTLTIIISAANPD